MRFLSPARFPLVFYLLAFLPVTSMMPQLCVGQASPNSASPPHVGKVPPPRDQEQFLSYWTAEPGWSSELQLRNNAPGQDLQITPVLRLPDGAETMLAPVTIKSQEVQSIDLETAIGNTAPRLMGTWGSVVLRYRSPSAASLYAAMMIRRNGHPIAFHIDGIGESQALQSGSREGIWWLPNSTANDWLVVSNQGKNTVPLDLSLYDAHGNAHRQQVLLGPGETTRYSVRRLTQAAGFAGPYGGLKVSTTAHAGSLNTLHFLFDETAGFSAILKMFDYDPGAKLEERDYARTGVWTLRAPMLALSNPDPALAFPQGTRLRPQLFIRNATSKPIDATVRFNWRGDTATGKASGPALHLSPYETRLIDVAALQDGKTLPQDAHWTSVTLTTNSKPDELVAVAASYDATLRYGAQTPFSDQLTFKWEGGMWEYDSFHDSIITAGNGGTKPTQAAFTIFYNQGTRKYELEQALQPDEQMWVDVGKLIRQSVPDKHGNTLPVDLSSGSYEIRDLTNKGAGTLFEGKVIYDKSYGHVAYGCAGCCGYDILNVTLWYNPLGIPLGYTSGQGVYAPDMCQGGGLADVSDAFYSRWSTANGAVATVDTYGFHRGVSVGSTTSQTSGSLNENHYLRNCPLHVVYPSGGDNVTPTISGPNTVWFFGNLTVSGYVTSAQLTSSGGSSTTWNITAGANKITVSSYTGSSINVLSSGTAFSSSVGDVNLTATANGQTSAPFSITTRTPNLAVAGSIATVCDGTYGYATTLNYTVEDQLLAALPSHMPVNENWTTAVSNDYSGTNWSRGIPGGFDEAGSAFADVIQGDHLSSTPVPTCDGNNTATVHWGQEWRIGSIAAGFGRRIQRDTLQKYIGHAAHTAITSPAP